jgi:hypothetical protein
MFFFRLFTLCSARVSALVIVLSDSSCERIGKWGDFSDFEKGQIVGARLAGASVTRNAILLCVSSATLSKVMSADTNYGKTTSAKRNSGRTPVITSKASKHRLDPGNFHTCNASLSSVLRRIKISGSERKNRFCR